MTVLATVSLRDELQADLVQARSDLDEARLRRLGKDTPDHRAAVLEVRGRIDALLDMWLDVAAA
jgi:hypothetical protein